MSPDVETGRTCSIFACENRRYAKGYCRNHYNRLIRHGDPMGGKHYNVGAACSIDGCEKPARARGWCIAHWTLWRNNGDPLIKKVGSAAAPGEQNRNWRGDNIGYFRAHERVADARGPARNHACADCGQPAVNWSYDHLDPDERVMPDDPKQMPYSTKIEHYQARCLQCHWRFDRPAMARRAG